MLPATLLALVSLVAFSPSVSAQELVGRASVIDGDTLEIRGQRIRIEGIDAPESRQVCTDKKKGLRVMCGSEAALWLSTFIDQRTVHCQSSGRDRYRRLLAQCSVGGEDVGAAMVRNGWALAYRQYSLRYVEPEEAAQREESGLWGMVFTPPWEWRRGKKS